MSMAVEKAMEKFVEDLKKYECTKKFPGGMVLHFSPVGERGFFIGTLTAYDKNGLKSERAFPLKQFMKVVNEIEDLLKAHQTTSFTGILVGWNPTRFVKSFCYNKKVHRLFFLEESELMDFIREFTRPDRVAQREVDVVVTIG